MRAVVPTGSGRGPTVQAVLCRFEDFDPQRVALGCVRGMGGGTIAAWAGRQAANQVGFGEDFEIVAGPDGAGLHKILFGVGHVACGHEDIADIMDQHFGYWQILACKIRQRAGQIGVAAVVIVIPRERVVGVGIAAGADHIVDRAAEFIPAVPIERVVGDRRQGAQVGDGGIHLITG